MILLTLNLNNNQIKFGSIKDPKFVPVVSRRRKTIKSPLLINARDASKRYYIFLDKERHLEEVWEEVEPRGSFLNQDDSSDEGISRAKSNDKSPLKSWIVKWNIIKCLK